MSDKTTSKAKIATAPLFDWLTERASGVLLHPTSFPGAYGIGTLDGAVDAWLAFLQLVFSVLYLK